MKLTIKKHDGTTAPVEGKSVAELVDEYGVVSVFVGDKSVAQLQNDGLSSEEIDDLVRAPEPKPSPATPDIPEGRAAAPTATVVPAYDSKFNPREGALVPHVTFAKGQDRIASDKEVDALAEQFGADCVFLDGIPFAEVLATEDTDARGWDQRCFVENQRAELEADRINANAPATADDIARRPAVDPSVVSENEARSVAEAKDRQDDEARRLKDDQILREKEERERQAQADEQERDRAAKLDEQSTKGGDL